MVRLDLPRRLALSVALLGAACVLGAWLFGAAGALAPAVAGAIIAAWYGRRVARSIARVADGAVRIASVERGHRIELEGPPELHRVARAVNRLADRLNTLIDTEAAERARLASILETMSEGVIVVDAQGFVESANPAAFTLLGAPPSFQAGQLLTSLTSNFVLNQTAVECARTGTPRQATLEIYDRRTPGAGIGRRFVQVTAAPLGRQSGPGRALVLITDLTEVRRVEVTRREFVSNASHELRTPIAAIKAAVETLQRGAVKDPEACADFLRRIEEDAQRMDALVQEMLDLSRLESGQTPLHLAPLDVSGLIASVAERFRPQAAERGLRVVVDATPPPPLVNADREQLEIVLSNLVGNALKFTPNGGQVTLSAGSSGDEVSIKVKDTGQGIAPEHLPHIFERFYKADLSRAAAGTGLGLAISKHIVQAHGGALSAESRLGEGSIFIVTLPALAAE